MEIKEQETDNKGSFYVEVDGVKKAEMTYSKAGTERIIIDHTEVSDDLRGTGVGLKLVEYAVNYVREKGIRILPLCPFAKATLQKHPEWQDVW